MKKIQGSLSVLASLNARRVNRGLEVVDADVTLALNSASQYVFNGTVARSVTLPTGADIKAGYSVYIDNEGTSTVAIAGVTVGADRRVEVVALQDNPSINAHWLVRSAAGDASSIAYDPTGNVHITSTDVQGALDDAEAELVDLNDNKLSLSGGTMSGAIAMGNNSITGLTDPVNAQDAATKKYVDDEIDALEDILVKGISWQTRVLGVYADLDAIELIALPVAGDRAIADDSSIIYVYNGTAWEVAVAAPDAGMAAPDLSAPNTVLLFDGTSWNKVYWESTTAGDGLQLDGFEVSINPALAGAGLSYATGVLSVNLGEGLELDGSDNLQVKLEGTTLARSANGIKVNIADASLEEVAGGLKVKLDPAGAIGLDAGNAGLEVLVKDGISIDGNAIRLDPTAAGAGLGYAAGVLSITGGNGIVVDATGLAIDLDATNPGLEFNEGKLRSQRAYRAEFAVLDWGTAAAGKFTLTIAETTHLQGVRPMVEIFDDAGDKIFVDRVNYAANGDITLEVPEVPEGTFAGSIKIVAAHE